MQGTGALRLASSARACEVYALDSSGCGGAPSYVCSLQGTPVELDVGPAAAAADTDAAAAAAPPALWAIELAWAPPQRAPPAVLLKLLSLAQRDVLLLHSLELLPAAAPAPALAGEAAGTARLAAAAAAAAAGASSQMDDVRRLLVLAAGGGGSSGDGGGGGGGDDPRRRLMASIASAALQQSAATTAGRPGQQQDEAARRRAEQQAEEEQQSVMAAVRRLDERVARVEAQLEDVAAMLWQLLLGQQQRVQPDGTL